LEVDEGEREMVLGQILMEMGEKEERLSFLRDPSFHEIILLLL
jgi:hypothetical protein